MNALQGVGAAVVKFLWKIGLAIILAVFVAALFSWARSNPRQAQATTNKVMNAGASVIGWAADGVTGMTGGSAAEAAGTHATEVIMVQNEAPSPWRQSLASAVILWNRGLTGVQLRVGDCVPDRQCIKVKQVSDLPDEDGRLVLGRTSTFFGTSIKFNKAAVGHVPASFYAKAACHELGHALGAEHRTVASSCMSKVIGPGVSTRPDAKDFKTVNDKFGH